MSIGKLEDTLARGLAAVHKEITGRGPQNVRVRLLGDIMAFRFADALTQLERSLVLRPGGPEQVRTLRSELLKVCMDRFDPYLQEQLGVGIQDAAAGFDPRTGRAYGVLALSGQVEA